MDKRRMLDGAGLVLALTFVFSSMFIPHLDTVRDRQGMDDGDPAVYNLAEATWQRFVTGEREGYPYTIHADENVHWGYTAAVQRTDGAFVDWVSGGEGDQEGLFSLRGAVHERGFHVLLAQTQELTGVSWYNLFQFGPALWFTFTAFGVWAMLRPHPAAVPAAALVGLVPTSPRFLGPAILVPIGFSLAWLPATQILSRPARKSFGASMLALAVAVWAFFVHLIGGFAAVGLLLISGMLGTAGQRRRALGLLAIGLLPLAWLYRAFSAGVEAEFEKIGDLPIDFTIFDHFGTLTLGLWAAGCVIVSLLAHRTDEDDAIPTWAGASIGALGLIVASVTLFEERPYATYDRWHPVFFFTAAVPAGFAIATAGRLAHRTVQEMLPDGQAMRRVAPAIGIAAAVLLSGAAASKGLAYHIDQPYYHVIEDGDWERYTWIRDNVDEDHAVFLTHPWKAPVLGAMTDMTPHAYLQPGSPPVRGEDYRDYARTGGSLPLFVTNDITLVATSGKPPFEVFETKRPGVHAMDENVTEQIAEIRAMERGG